jgi:hypothetical protein
MTDDARAARTIQDTLQGLPLSDRLSALMCSIIVDEPRAAEAIADFISCAGMMARMLPPAERLRICWALLEEVQAVGARWN